MVDNESIICSNKNLRNETVSIMVNITNLQLKKTHKCTECMNIKTVPVNSIATCNHNLQQKLLFSI